MEQGESINPKELDLKEGFFWWDQTDKHFKNRWGIVDSVIENEKGLEPLYRVMQTPIEATDWYSRILGFAYITEDILRNPPPELQKLLENHLEAVLPLHNSGIPELANCYVVYFGKNDPSRATAASVDTLDQQMTAAKAIFEKEPTPPRPLGPGYAIVNPSTDPDIATQFARLLASELSDTEEGVFEEIQNPESGLIPLAIVKEADGKRIVVSATIAAPETWEVNRNGKVIEINHYEITSGVTVPEERGHGHYKILQAELIDRLATAEPAINIITGLSNLGEGGVLKAGHDTGRKSTIEAAEALDLKAKGFCEHSIVGDSFAHALLTFIPQKDLQELHSKKESKKMAHGM